MKKLLTITLTVSIFALSSAQEDKFYKKIVDSNPKSEKYVIKGNVAVNEGDYEKAIKFYKKRIDKNYFGPPCMYCKGNVAEKIAKCYNMLGDEENERSWYLKAINCYKREIGSHGEIGLVVLLRMAECLDKIGQTDQAATWRQKYNEWKNRK